MKTIALYAALLILLAVFGGIGYLAYDSYLHDKDSTPQATEEPATKPATKKPKTKYDIGAPDPQEMLELLNMERAKVGVAPLVIDENVQKSAQLKADDMHDRNYFAHNVLGTDYTLTPEMADYVNRSCSRSGENITDNRIKDDYTSAQIHRNFSSSKPHYEAMINPDYSKIGFGMAGTKVVQHLCVSL